MTDQERVETLKQLRNATTIIYLGTAQHETVCTCGQPIHLGHRIAQMADGSNLHETCVT